jgi:methoxymalonate biosynthesis protein
VTPEEFAQETTLIGELVADQADAWDEAESLPTELLSKLGQRGLLCAQVPVAFGGLGISSELNGELTAVSGSWCSSLRSVMTSSGMAAWAIQRLGNRQQREEYLPRLANGQIGAVGFSEPSAGSDLAAMQTQIRPDGEFVIVDGLKCWMTAAAYADLLIIIGRYDDGAAVVAVPANAPGVTLERIPRPLGCRAAGHANVALRSVRLPAASVLGYCGGQSLPLLVTAILAYGRISVAWGCVGILRACLNAVTQHARSRTQFGKPLAEHQLVARHIAQVYAAEQVATRACEHASRCWDSRSPEMAAATVLAKYVSSANAAQGSASAMQVLASAASRDTSAVARAFRDAKLMEIIEGTHEICELMLARHALTP